IRLLFPSHEGAAENRSAQRNFLPLAADFSAYLIEAPWLVHVGDAPATRGYTGRLKERAAVGVGTIGSSDPLPWMKNPHATGEESVLLSGDEPDVRVLNLKKVLRGDGELRERAEVFSP